MGGVNKSLFYTDENESVDIYYEKDLTFIEFVSIGKV
jgi:CMP-N-acetylneuraminic acid synthetase